MKSIQITVLTAAVLSLTACSTSSDMHTQSVPNAAYRQAMADSDPAQFDLPAAGSEAEQAMLEGVKSLFSDYTRENLEQNVTRVYADQVYFRDAFKQLDSAQAIRDYLLKGLEPIEQGEFVFHHVARSGGEFYFDWTMRLDFKKTPPGTWEESIGVSRMRFNSEGKVIFHQDYWDPTDIVYRRIPIAKQLIAYVKSKM